MKNIQIFKKMRVRFLAGGGIGLLVAGVGFPFGLWSTFFTDLHSNSSHLSVFDWLWIGINFPAILAYQTWLFRLNMPPQGEVWAWIILPPIAIILQWAFVGLLIGLRKIWQPKPETNQFPTEKQQDGISIFSLGATYFGAWRSLRWFLLMLLPVGCSAVASWCNQRGVGEALCIVLLGTYLAACIFVTLYSGKSPSKWGTCFQQTKPMRFRLCLTLITILYLGFSSAGYFLRLFSRD